MSRVVLALGLLALSGSVTAQTVAERLERGRSQERSGDLEAALVAYEAAVAANADDWRGYLLRGQIRFRLGQTRPSLEDFDRVVALAPDQEPYLWQRGISQYYAGEFAPCRRQFELHRTVNPDDVENAVWHFLCVTRAEGFAEARAAILPVGPDPRPPMTTVYDLFRGKARVADVLADAGVDDQDRAAFADPSAAFYAHLYLALYLEAIDQIDAAREHLDHAAALDFPHYMGDVAKVHLERLSAQRDLSTP